jgi:hypothetical protein
MEDVWSVIASFLSNAYSLRRVCRMTRRAVDKAAPRGRLAIESGNRLGILLGENSWKELYECSLGKIVDYEYATREDMFDYAFIYGNHNMMSATYRRDSPSIFMIFDGEVEKHIIDDLIPRMVRTNPDCLIQLIRSTSRRWALANHEIELIIFDNADGCKPLMRKLNYMFHKFIITCDVKSLMERIKNKKLLRAVVAHAFTIEPSARIKPHGRGFYGDELLNWYRAYFTLQEFRLILNWDEITRLPMYPEAYFILKEIDMSHPVFNPDIASTAPT